MCKVCQTLEIELCSVGGILYKFTFLYNKGGVKIEAFYKFFEAAITVHRGNGFKDASTTMTIIRYPNIFFLV